ncbi:MAG: DUF3794 domain-containing protein [Clostridia bacterium]|nr:DUF3794 domain-containing protein [Clostridia bacterium]
MTSDYQTPQFLSLLPDLTGEAGAECEMILPDYCPNVLRILQTTARPVLRSAQTTGNRITVDGYVEYRVLYLAEDGSGMKSVTQQGQFSYAGELPEGTEDTQVLLQVRGVSARALNPKKIFVRASVAITVRSCKSVAIKAPSLPQPCEVLVRRELGARRIGSAKKPLRIADEFENDSGRVIGEILQWSISFRETERKPLSDKLIVKGDMIQDLLCTNRDGAIIPIRKVFPISQILDLPELTEDACFCTEFSLISASFLPREESPEGNQTVAYDVEIDVRADAYASAEFCRTEDAYGLRTRLDCKSDSISVDCIYPIDEYGTVRETVETGICGEILRIDATAELKSTRLDKESNRIICEGGWDCRILMTDTDGTPCAAIREIPFTLHLPANDCVEPVRNDTCLSLSDLSWTRLDAERVELTGTYRWSGILFHRKQRTILTEVSVSGDRKRSEESVTLYYATAGESAWEIAKEHACGYNDLLKQNRLEDDRMTEDRMLMILSC